MSTVEAQQWVLCYNYREDLKNKTKRKLDLWCTAGLKGHIFQPCPLSFIYHRGPNQWEMSNYSSWVIILSGAMKTHVPRSLLTNVAHKTMCTHKHARTRNCWGHTCRPVHIIFSLRLLQWWWSRLVTTDCSASTNHLTQKQDWTSLIIRMLYPHFDKYFRHSNVNLTETSKSPNDLNLNIKPQRAISYLEIKMLWLLKVSLILLNPIQ